MIRKAKTENGWVEGIPAADPRITAFKGIPFAAPPVGENRWRAPQPAKGWEGVRKCYAFAPIAMQKTPGLDPDNIYTREWNVDPEIPMDEDCLYLNVWTPAKSADEKLPVFVWYFGGALIEGNPAEMEFDGERIARRGIVVVTVNYRLNVFGFLTHPEIRAEAPEAPANFGHLDQQAGTRRVKRNIAAFGGDPENITIGGQSAGGMSVWAQLTSPQNEGLFQKAIVMSGLYTTLYGPVFPQRSYEEIEQEGVKFFEYMGVHSLAEARALDAFYIRDKYAEYGGFWGTVDDGKFQVGNYLDNVMKGKRMRIPLMVGRTSDEFKDQFPGDTPEEFEAIARRCLGDKAEEYFALFGGDLAAAQEASLQSRIDIAFRAIARKEAENGIGQPLYYYIFDPEIPGWDHPGTFHSCDLWFFFETLAKCWRPYKGKHYDLARQMCNYWANFMRSADPNGNDADGSPMPLWKPFTDAEPNSIWFGDTAQPKLDLPDRVMKLFVDKCTDN